jgi:hypothetical protein
MVSNQNKDENAKTSSNDAIKKGQINDRPTTERPATPPKAQGPQRPANSKKSDSQSR